MLAAALRSVAAPVRRLQRRPARHPLSVFEFWPDWLFYAPVFAQWIAFGFRYGDMSLPTAANPRIEGGGLCGESKSTILDQVGEEARHLLAAYAVIAVDGSDLEADLASAEAAMSRAGLEYPVVGKPDIGCNGAGVRVLADQASLRRYLAEFPGGLRVVLQTLIAHDGEAGLFYVRPPGAALGSITSITLKFPPFVVGDGFSTLEQLVLADPRAGRIPHLYLPRLGERRTEVPTRGQRVRLVFVGNHCRGSIFRDATQSCTPELLAAIERVVRTLPEFHFGRIDVRFTDLAALRRGEGFRIIEINGVGSEATHVWDPRTSLWKAWRDELSHFGWAWRIAAHNRARGHAPIGLPRMLRLWREQRRLMHSYPMSD
jgi:hypothetical protein